MKVGNLRIFWRHTRSKVNESECFIKSNDDLVMGYGNSKCSKKDTFNRKLGMKLAFERAVKGIVTKKERTELWNQFKVEHPKALKQKR